jgi:hypothetical protein
MSGTFLGTAQITASFRPPEPLSCPLLANAAS